MENMMNYKVAIQIFIIILSILPTISFAVTDDEIIESVKNHPQVRQRILEVTKPISKDPEVRFKDEIYPNKKSYVVPLEGGCGVAGCGGNVLVVFHYTSDGPNPRSRYVSALVKIKHTKIQEISLAKISTDTE